MTKITFHIELDNKVKADSTQNIQIRITQNKSLKRVTTGCAVEKKFWNDEKKKSEELILWPMNTMQLYRINYLNYKESI